MEKMKPILKKVARSLYLSLRILPRRLQEPMALAYLLARAADTITDTPIVPAEERVRWLSFLQQRLQGQFAQAQSSDEEEWQKFSQALVGPQEIPEERTLLLELSRLVSLLWQLPKGDRSDIQWVLGELVQGMQEDLQRWGNCNPSLSSRDTTAGSSWLVAKAFTTSYQLPATSCTIVPLATWADLDRYCHYAAGVVGPFWTRMLFRHVPRLGRLLDQKQMEQWGESFGKGLQLINVLKDISHDLQNGRCYLPQEGLDPFHLKAEDLSKNITRLQPLLQQMIQKSLTYLESGENYLEALPRRYPLLRLSIIWPLWIGLATLQFLQADTELLNANRPHKISRKQLRRLLGVSLGTCHSNALLARYFREIRALLTSIK